MNKMTVRDIDVRDKRVLVRVDFNVPMDEKTGAVTDVGRIRAAIPTIDYLVERKAKVILASHLGRPNGKVVEGMRMAPVARRLAELVGRPVATAPDCVGPDAEKAVGRMKQGDILLLDNLRFHAEEEKGAPSFAEALARLADVFVNDAFGTAHRPHASVSVIARYLPAVAGFLMEKEIKMLGSLTENPVHPFGALLGGAKISDKVALVENVMGKVDSLLIGGGMAATFLKARTYEIGQSLIESERVGTAAGLMEKAALRGIRVLLPSDVVVADKLDVDVSSQVVPVESIPRDKRIVDIGPQTVRAFSKELHKCKTVFWNGPMGVYELAPFAAGTQAIARLLAGLKATTVIGGGSTADVVEEMKLTDEMTFVSTGGGASLSFLGGEKLPGIEALRDAKG